MDTNNKRWWWVVVDWTATTTKPCWAVVIVLISLIETASAWPSLEPKTMVVGGRRCCLCPCQTTDRVLPPVILLGGMAQTIETWEPHLSFLSKQREILVYEGIGQGPLQIEKGLDASLKSQALSLKQVIMELYGPNQKVDLLGFSLGARIALAFSRDFPDSVRKVHLTGVAANRSDSALVAISSWNDLLSSGEMRGFGWSILQSTYSSTFLKRNINRLPFWVENISTNNCAEGLLAILREAHNESPAEIAKGISTIDAKLIVGQYDLMAPPSEASILGDTLGIPLEVIEVCGHAVPSEQAAKWRKNALHFLN